MNKLQSYIKTFLLWELWLGLSVTLRNFFKRSVTIQYPEEKTPQSFRFRGLHALRHHDQGQVACDRRQIRRHDFCGQSG